MFVKEKARHAGLFQWRMSMAQLDVGLRRYNPPLAYFWNISCLIF
jgi:hypothetical protein